MGPWTSDLVAHLRSLDEPQRQLVDRPPQTTVDLQIGASESDEIELDPISLDFLVMLIDNPQVGLGIPPEWMQMLMRGQADRNRQGQSIFVPAEIEPGAYPAYFPASIAQPPAQPGAASTAYPPNR